LLDPDPDPKQIIPYPQPCLVDGRTSPTPRDILPGWGGGRGRGLQAGAPRGRTHLSYSLGTFYLDGALEEGGDLSQSHLVDRAPSHLTGYILPGRVGGRGWGLELGAPGRRRLLCYSLGTFYLDGLVEDGGDLSQSHLVDRAPSHLTGYILPGRVGGRWRGLEAGAPSGRRLLCYSIGTFYLDGLVKEGGD
jgi:hypothetical protein